MVQYVARMGQFETSLNFLRVFLAYFSNNIQRKRHFSYLYTIKYTQSESLKDFLAREKKEVGNVYDFNRKVALPIFT